MSEQGMRAVTRRAWPLDGHRIEQDDPLTVSPSVLCSDCGTHGFIRNGRWVGA